MKASKWLWLRCNKIWVALGICCFFFGSLLLSARIYRTFNYISNEDASGFCDLNFRYNEIACSHTGINPFHVWNGTVETPLFEGFPQNASFAKKDQEKKFVHAYPPWHTTYCWFYGWVSKRSCLYGLMIVNVLVLLGMVCVTLNVFKEDWRMQVYALGVGYILLKPALDSNICCGNYALVMLACLYSMWKGLKAERWLFVGVMWAFAMVKPQIATLYFWPLLWSRQYKAMAVAVGICFAATLWPSYLYRESSLDLLLQIPEIGAPYIDLNWGWRGLVLIRKYLGEAGYYCWVGFCFTICGVLSYRLRNARSWTVKFLPALIIFPFWTYTNDLDYCILFPVWLFIFSVLLKGEGISCFSVGEIRWLAFLRLYFPVVVLFQIGWYLLFHCFKLFNPTGLGWIFHSVKYSMGCFVFIFLIWYIGKLFRNKIKDDALLP